MNGCQKGERNSINKLLVRHQIALLLIARGWMVVRGVCVCCDGICVISAEGESGETAIGHSQHLIERVPSGIIILFRKLAIRVKDAFVRAVFSFNASNCCGSCHYQRGVVGIWSHRKLPIVHRTTFVGSLSGGG